VPSFFAKPLADGRGNIQTLALIRTALSLRWQLICFDQSWDLLKPEKPNPSFDDRIALSVQRDVSMAKNLAKARKGGCQGPCDLRWAACPNAQPFKQGECGRPVAEALAIVCRFVGGQQIDMEVRSVNVIAHSGGFFAMVSEGDKPPVARVQTIRSKRQLTEAEAHALHDNSWDCELNLPKATPATFLATPSTDPPASRP
jgi:hypothetical protein